MATLTLANPLESHPQYDGRLIDSLVDIVARVQKPKPPRSTTEPDNSPDKTPDKNASMLLDLWQQGEQMAAQAIELRSKSDPLTIALNGFPDVYTSYAYAAGR